MLRHRSTVVPLVALALTVAACGPLGGGNESPNGTVSVPGGTPVNVTLSEYNVETDIANAPAGEVTFHVTNEGPDDVHQFLVILADDLAPDALPTLDDGSVDIENGEGVDEIEIIESIAVGETKDLTVSLEIGDYVLICNFVEGGESHYQEGMRTAFKVE
jgi:uncharacterized cupredoxin-like copper-binding protein